MLKMPEITTLPGGRKVRTDLRPYADEVALVTDEETAPAEETPAEKEEQEPAPGKTGKVEETEAQESNE